MDKKSIYNILLLSFYYRYIKSKYLNTIELNNDLRIYTHTHTEEIAPLLIIPAKIKPNPIYTNFLEINLYKGKNSISTISVNIDNLPISLPHASDDVKAKYLLKIFNNNIDLDKKFPIKKSLLTNMDFIKQDAILIEKKALLAKKELLTLTKENNLSKQKRL